MLALHTTLSVAVAPELRMDEIEAREFAKAIDDVSRHYPMTWLDEKTLAWFNLIQCTAVIYGSKIYAVRLRLMMERAQRPPPPPSPVHAPAQPQTQAQQRNGSVEPDVPKNIRVGEIAGVGSVEFPPDHPLAARKPH